MWTQIDSDRLEHELEKSQLRKFYRHYEKVYAKAGMLRLLVAVDLPLIDTKGKEVIDFERKCLSRMLLEFVALAKSKDELGTFSPKHPPLYFSDSHYLLRY